DVWRNVSGDAAAFRGLFYPFQRAFREHTGQRFGAFREEALQAFREETENAPRGGTASAPALPDTAARFGAAHTHFVADEEFPQWMNDTTIVYVKSSYRKIPAFYSRNILTGEEKKIKWK